MIGRVCRVAVLGSLLAMLGACKEEGADPAAWSRLGTESFSPEAWAGADQEGRGAMVADLLASNTLIGATPEAVEALLGTPTGYYDYETNMAYVVGPKGEVESSYADGYLLVFETDGGEVSKILAVPEL